MAQDMGHGSALRKYGEQHLAEMVAFLRWLVEQESMSRVPEAINRIAANIAGRFEEIGAAVDLIPSDSFGMAVRARFAAGPGCQETRPLLVLGHTDTVWPIGTLARRPFRIEGDRAFGPGSFDMKAGIAVIFFGLSALRDLGIPFSRPVTVLLTCDEETGTHFGRSIVEEEASGAHSALVLEPPIPGGNLKTGRKGVGQFELRIKGRSAHAGIDPRAGVNAITELAHQILAIQAMTDYELGTTLNVGVVSGGTLPNVIPAEARARIDLRFRTMGEGARIADALSKLVPSIDGASIEVQGGLNRPPLLRTAAIGELFSRARRLAAEIGFEIGEGAVGGGSDANFVAALGVPVLDGLGVDGAGAHAEHEHIIISDMPRRAALFARLVETSGEFEVGRGE